MSVAAGLVLPGPDRDGDIVAASALRSLLPHWFTVAAHFDSVTETVVVGERRLTALELAELIGRDLAWRGARSNGAGILLVPCDSGRRQGWRGGVSFAARLQAALPGVRVLTSTQPLRQGVDGWLATEADEPGRWLLLSDAGTETYGGRLAGVVVAIAAGEGRRLDLPAAPDQTQFRRANPDGRLWTITEDGLEASADVRSAVFTPPPRLTVTLPSATVTAEMIGGVVDV